MCVHAWGQLKWSFSPVSTCLPLVLQFQSLICIYYHKIEWGILLVGVLRFMSQVFVWISFPRVIFLCTFATLFCVCTDLRAWCAVKHLQEMYWDFSFHFKKSSWNSFTLRFIGAQPFILQSAVFRLTRRKTDTNATPVQTMVLRFVLLFFPISMRRSEQFILPETSYPSAKWYAKVFGSVSALLLTTASWYETAWPSWIRHYCHPEQSYQYPNPIPTFYHQQPFRTNMEHFT